MASGQSPLRLSSSPPLSPLLSTSSARSSSRPKQSPVWDYFVFDQSTGKSTCQVDVKKETGSDAVEEKCAHSLAGKYTTNLKQHLKKEHPRLYTEFLAKEEEREKKQLSVSPNIPGSFKSSSKHGRQQLTLEQTLRQKKMLQRVHGIKKSLES